MNRRFETALARFDAANAADPNREVFQGREYPKELLYAERMTVWLERLAPDASEALRLAVRAQHLCRGKIPRSSYPMDRQGYQRWRAGFPQFHPGQAGALLPAGDYQEAVGGRRQV